MNAEIFAALRQLEKERGIPVDYMVEKITQALVAAYKKDRDGYTDNVYVELTEDAMRMYAQKEVVDEVITPATEVTLDAARKVDPHAQLGDLVNVEIKTQACGRIAAQTAKQVIIQGIREAERGMIFESFSSKEHEILTGSVLRFEPNGDMTIRIGQGTDKTAWNIGAEVPNPDNFGTEYNGDYSFDGAGTVTFEKMTMRSGSSLARWSVVCSFAVVSAYSDMIIVPYVSRRGPSPHPYRRYCTRLNASWEFC